MFFAIAVTFFGGFSFQNETKFIYREIPSTIDMVNTINDFVSSLAGSQFAGGTYFGSTILQYIAFFIAVIACVLIAKIIYFIVQKYGSILTAKTETQFDDVLIEMAQTPVLFGGFIAGLFFGYQFLTPSEGGLIAKNFMTAISSLIIINIAWFAIKLIDAIIQYFVVPLSSKTESKLDDQLIPILRKLSKASIAVLTLIIILSSFGVDVLPLLAGLGVGGLAIAFAAQKTVEDMFGGISIFTSKPFVVGNSIKTTGIEGTVESVGIRNTRIRDWDNRLITIPNGKVAQDVITNISSEGRRRVSVTLGLTYSTSTKKMEEALEILKSIAKEHKDVDNNDIRAIFKEYADSSLNIWFVYYIINQERKFDVMSEMNLEIKKRFEKAKLDFAFPSQSIYLEKMAKK